MIFLKSKKPRHSPFGSVRAAMKRMENCFLDSKKQVKIFKFPSKNNLKVPIFINLYYCRANYNFKGVNTLKRTIAPITITTIPATLFTLTITLNLIFFLNLLTK